MDSVIISIVPRSCEAFAVLVKGRAVTGCAHVTRTIYRTDAHTLTQLAITVRTRTWYTLYTQHCFYYRGQTGFFLNRQHLAILVPLCLHLLFCFLWHPVFSWKVWTIERPWFSLVQNKTKEQLFGLNNILEHSEGLIWMKQESPKVWTKWCTLVLKLVLFWPSLRAWSSLDLIMV